MNKTVHKKLTEKHLTAYQPVLLSHNGGELFAGMEANILKEAAKELLQPRQEAIARILKLARELN